MAELGSRDGQRAVEVHDPPALHHGGSLNGLGFAVFPQDPLEDLKDADGGHHQVGFWFEDAEKAVSLEPVGEHFDPA
jgi:hypothetical protein